MSCPRQKGPCRDPEPGGGRRTSAAQPSGIRHQEEEFQTRGKGTREEGKGKNLEGWLVPLKFHHTDRDRVTRGRILKFYNKEHHRNGNIQHFSWTQHLISQENPQFMICFRSKHSSYRAAARMDPVPRQPSPSGSKRLMCSLKLRASHTKRGRASKKQLKPPPLQKEGSPGVEARGQVWRSEKDTEA